MTEETTAPDPLTRATGRLIRLERTGHRQRAVNVALAIALAISVSGWWLSDRDNSATVKAGQVADCRAFELALTLDDFRVIVSPGISSERKEAAAADLKDIGPLKTRYRRCGGS